MKKIIKFPWFKIVILLLLLWIILQVNETKKLAEKAYGAATEAVIYSNNAADYSAEASDISNENKKTLKKICNELNIFCGFSF